jgi:RHS repeat-associated protein
VRPIIGDNNRSVMRLVVTAFATLLAGAIPGAAQTMSVEFYHVDGQGNVLALTDWNGTVVESHDYDVFGQEVVDEYTRLGTQPKRFTGKERDTETGWDYFGARYYASKVGRFTTSDPAYTIQENLVDPQRWNKYAYARNNPLRYVDPDGRAVVLANDLGGPKKPGPNAGPLAWIAYTIDVALFGLDPGMAVMPVGAAAKAAEGGTALVIANRAAGKVAEAKVAEELVAEGKAILGSQVCCKTSEGRRFIDFVTKDAAGDVAAVEVKSGGATRSVAQRTKDAEIAAGRGTFVGKNAPKELKGQQIAVETAERKPAN